MVCVTPDDDTEQWKNCRIFSWKWQYSAGEKLQQTQFLFTTNITCTCRNSNPSSRRQKSTLNLFDLLCDMMKREKNLNQINTTGKHNGFLNNIILIATVRTRQSVLTVCLQRLNAFATSYITCKWNGTKFIINWSSADVGRIDQVARGKEVYHQRWDSCSASQCWASVTKVLLIIEEEILWHWRKQAVYPTYIQNGKALGSHPATRDEFLWA